MILLYLFILGCFVTGLVALGLVFALAAAGYGADESQQSPSQEDDARQSAPLPSDTVYRL